MSKECIEIGIIQAFLDGELSPRESVNVTGHTAICSNCAQLMTEAEEENVLAFSALDRELDTLVPTQRLWAKISDSIEFEKQKVSVWHRFYNFVTVNIATPSFAAAAAVLIVFGAVFAVVTMQKANNTPNVAVNSAPIIIPPTTPATNETAVKTTEAPVIQVASSNHSPEKLRQLVKGVHNTPARPEYLKYEYLPGEESYIKTIGELERSVTVRNASLNAGGQVAYQRDLAVVEDSIKKMKDVVRKNPRNQSARQVLYSSYQDKIDLLNSAAQRDELVATLDYR